MEKEQQKEQQKERLANKIIHLRQTLHLLNPFYPSHDKVEKELMEAVAEYKQLELT